jgi:ABC-2 type transport system ATP-binding protein
MSPSATSLGISSDGASGTAEANDLALAAQGLVKTYGDVRALDGVDLTVPAGSIFGFLGPNGAGKTTTLRILTGLARPTSGTASIFGHDVADRGSSTRMLIGFLPDVPGFYGWMTGEEYLRFAGGLFGLEQRVLSQRVAALLDLAGLSGVRSRVAAYSRGMKQRLGVAQALINAPRLLMLDEPTSALDPIGRKDVLDMLASLRGRTTVFFSTHILADVERVCDTVAILDKGRVRAQAPIGELKARYAAHRVTVEVEDGAGELADALRHEPWVTSVDMAGGGALSIAVVDVEKAQHVLPALVAERGLGLRRFEGGEVALEDVFVQLVSGDESAAEQRPAAPSGVAQA